jgi:hypothetical protein
MQEFDAMRKNFEIKEQELIALEEKLNARESVSSCTLLFFIRRFFVKHISNLVILYYVGFLTNQSQC